MAVLLHEFGHSFMAWATGIKANPWNIEWGDGSVGDVLLLRGIDENVDYRTALTDGHPAAIAATVMAGPGMNTLMFLFAGESPPSARVRSTIRSWVGSLTYRAPFISPGTTPVRFWPSSFDR
jgi:hypothetical protein